MTCCPASNTDTGRLFSRFAKLHRVRHQLLGFERTQRQLIDGLGAARYADADLLEIGCGAGYLHQALLESGARQATGIDLSQGMLDLARAGAQARGLAERAGYIWGDFVALADTVAEADITILDKVVCCYPDWRGLMDRALAKTRHAIGLTYPRDRAFVRAGVRLLGWGLRVAGCCYQPYLHDPQAIERFILESGFHMLYDAGTRNWLTQVYARTAAPA